MQHPRVFVLLLNWNGWRDTLTCLRSLEMLTYPNFEVVVIDNGSTDDSVVHVRKAYSRITLLETGKNLGFAGGNNVGIRYALDQGADYVWLLNNDTIVHPQALTAMVSVAEADPRVGAVGSVLYHMDRPKQIQAWGGGRVNLWRGKSWQLVAPGRLDYLTGASLLLRRAALDDVGILDEGFFMYWEDTDYSFRLRRRGWKLAVAEAAHVWHKESASTVRGSPRFEQFYCTSAVRFLRRYAPLPVLSLLLSFGERILRRLVRGRWAQAVEIWKALRVALCTPGDQT